MPPEILHPPGPASPPRRGRIPRPLLLLVLGCCLSGLYLIDVPPVSVWMYRFHRDVFDLSRHPWDWCLHLIGYGTIGFTFASLVCRARSRPLGRWGWMIVAVIPALIGAMDEITQIWNPRRSASVMDWLFDAGGSMLVVLWVKHLNRSAGAAAAVDPAAAVSRPAPPP